VLKFVLVGDSDVGKSQLVLRFTKDLFISEPSKTIGMEFATRELEYYNNASIKAQIWDAAGKERGSSFLQAYYRKALGTMLIYDVTDRNSFENILKWHRQIKESTHRNIAVSLIANKIDLAENRTVSAAEGLALAKENGMDYVETSAKTGKNVENAFRRHIMAVAGLLPDGKRRQSDPSISTLPPLPEGWISSKSRHRNGSLSYENIWTGERVEEHPNLSAVEYNTIPKREISGSVDREGIGLFDENSLDDTLEKDNKREDANCLVS